MSKKDNSKVLSQIDIYLSNIKGYISEIESGKEISIDALRKVEKSLKDARVTLTNNLD